MRILKFDTDEYYHVYNRGNHRRTIFHDAIDYQFFKIGLFRHNTTGKIRTFGSQDDRLVSVISYNLLPNHFHLMLRQEVENGISLFMYRLQRAYSLFSNRKRARTGTLYECPFKAKHVSTEAYFNHLPRYIHLNIGDLTPYDWRNGSVSNWKDLLKIMSDYPWSSHIDYMRQSQDLPILNLDLITELFPNPDTYEDFIRSWSTSDITIARSIIVDDSF